VANGVYLLNSNGIYSWLCSRHGELMRGGEYKTEKRASSEYRKHEALFHSSTLPPSARPSSDVDLIKVYVQGFEDGYNQLLKTLKSIPRRAWPTLIQSLIDEKLK
jgi:hypothetical protein